jgi:hypothetical protein
MENLRYSRVINARKAFTNGLNANGIRISIDGKGAWCDNVFVD